MSAYAVEQDIGRYEPGKPRAAALALAAFGLVAIALTLVWLDPPRLRQIRSALLTVNLIPVDTPQPKQVALPTIEERKTEPRPDRVVAPQPVVVTMPGPQPVQTVPTPAPVPPRAEPAPPASPAPAITRPTTADLGTRLVSANPPKYPQESRRRHETGTVVLQLIVGEDGRVERISVRDGSGFERLDKAALDAVGRWRWSPTILDGKPVRVTGLVRIPFVLKEE